MNTEHWIVKKPNGEEWGLIKRLIIDSATRRISYVDVIVANTGRLVRIPWESFEMHPEWITLSTSEEKVNEMAMKVSGPEFAATVTKEV
jgi:hypothetical protein